MGSDHILRPSEGETVTRAAPGRASTPKMGVASDNAGMSCYSVAEEIMPGRADFLVGRAGRR